MLQIMVVFSRRRLSRLTFLRVLCLQTKLSDLKMGVSVGRGSWVVGPKSWVVGSKSWVVGPKSWVVGPKSWVVGSKSWVVGSKSWVVGSKSWVVGRGLLIGRDLH